jgi:hypothetical protein
MVSTYLFFCHLLSVLTSGSHTNDIAKPCAQFILCLPAWPESLPTFELHALTTHKHSLLHCLQLCHLLYVMTLIHQLRSSHCSLMPESMLWTAWRGKVNHGGRQMSLLGELAPPLSSPLRPQISNAQSTATWHPMGIHAGGLFCLTSGHSFIDSLVNKYCSIVYNGCTDLNIEKMLIFRVVFVCQTQKCSKIGFFCWSICMCFPVFGPSLTVAFWCVFMTLSTHPHPCHKSTASGHNLLCCNLSGRILNKYTDLLSCEVYLHSLSLLLPKSRVFLCLVKLAQGTQVQHLLTVNLLILGPPFWTLQCSIRPRLGQRKRALLEAHI